MIEPTGISEHTLILLSEHHFDRFGTMDIQKMNWAKDYNGKLIASHMMCFKDGPSEYFIIGQIPGNLYNNNSHNYGVRDKIYDSPGVRIEIARHSDGRIDIYEFFGGQILNYRYTQKRLNGSID